MIKSFSLLVLFLVLSISPTSRAAEPLPGNPAQRGVSGTNTGPAAAGNGAPIDLGHGLTYLRVDSLTKPLPTRLTALVLDLRYVTTDEQSPAALKTLLASRPVSAPLFILVSPATPAALAPILTASPALTLGAPDSIPTPKVVVHTATDRRAYDALATGTPLAQLLSGKVEKERYNEASLVKDFKAGVPEPLPPVAVDPTAPKKTTVPAAADNGAPLTDHVLQRTVHLHAAMRALKPRS